MNEKAQEIYDDVQQILSNVCETKSQLKPYMKELHQMFRDDVSEPEIYFWLKQTTESIYQNS